MKKIGVSFSGPSIILVYTQDGKTRKREMPLRDLKVDSDCRNIVNRMKLRHNKYLESVSSIRLEKLVMLARENLKGVGIEMGLRNVDSMLKIDPEENMNQLNDTELKRRKELMDLTFEKNSIGKDHPDFVYDKEVQNGPAMAHAASACACSVGVAPGLQPGSLFPISNSNFEAESPIPIPNPNYQSPIPNP